MTVHCEKLAEKIDDLIEATTWVHSRSDIAHYCNIKPSTINYWCEQDRLTMERRDQLAELFAIKPGDLELPWSRFRKEVIEQRLANISDPWQRLLVEADLHSLMTIVPADNGGLRLPRIIHEDEDDPEPVEAFGYHQRIYLSLARPTALHNVAKSIAVLVKMGETVRSICPSVLCPDTAVPATVGPINLPIDPTTSKVFKMTGEGLQSLITALVAEPWPTDLLRKLNSAEPLSDDTLQHFAMTVLSRPEQKRHVYRLDYRVVHAAPD